MKANRIIHLFTLLACLLGSVSTRGQDPSPLLEVNVPPADHRLAYGPDELQFGELRLPKAPGPHPVIILIHGGCWKARIGNLDPRLTALDLLRPTAASLTEAGFATWNIEYRRVGNEGGGWPGTFHDAARATDFLRSIAEKHSLDLNRVAAMGHSAGGHLAFWIAARPKIPAGTLLHQADPLPVQAAINLDGPIDLKRDYPFAERFCGFAAIDEFMGGAPDQQPERYAAGSAATYLPLGVRQEIVIGSLADGIREQITAYQQEAQKGGDTVTTLDLTEAGHFGFLFPDSTHWKRVLERVVLLMDRK